MPFTTTIQASIIMQDTGGATPVTVATDSKSDQATDHDEYVEMEVTVPASTTDMAVDLSNFKVRSLFVKASAPVTMKQAGTTAYAQPVRSLFAATYEASNAPTTLHLSNAGTAAAQVRIIAGSKA